MAGQGPPVDDSAAPFSDDDFASGRTAVRIASVAALGGLLFGYDSAVINGAVDSIQEDFGIGNAELGFAVASALLGAAAGAMTESDAATLGDVFAMLQRLRMAHQVEQLAGGHPPGDVVTMADLSPLNRSLLGDGLREIAAVQRRVRGTAFTAG